MMRRRSGLCAALLLIAAAGSASAQFGKILKGGGVAFVVTKFGPDINRFLNKLTHTSSDDPQFATKVVPVLSVGTGGYAGAVQVAGPRNEVEKVQAVAQFEGNFSGLGLRVRGLVPIATKSVTNIRRVPGVGVSGLLDIKL
jgi:hypothetical protein